jgi:hypothetical protein
MNLPLESDEDDAPTYIPDENQEYTGENASHMKLEEDAAQSANFDDLIFNINEEDDDDSSDFF